MLRFFRVRYHLFVVLMFASGLAPVVAISAPADPLPASDGKWRHYQSPNFELYSRDSDTQSRELLNNLELLRATFFGMFKLVERRRLDVTVFLFDREKDFQAYLSNRLAKGANFSAFHVTNPDRALIVLGPANDRIAAQQIIFHEYVHHMYRASGDDPPVWINEGMAELFSTLVVKSNGLEFGRPSGGRLDQFRSEEMMSLEHLFAVDHDSSVFRSGSHTGLFYAESWALMHYWYFGQSDIPAAKVAAFIEEASRKPMPSSADLRRRFQEIFGMDYPAMEKRLDNYTSSGRYVWRRSELPKVEPASGYVMRPVTAAEARLRMAELALRVNRSPQAKLVLLEAAQNGTPTPRPFEALGADALREGDESSARERWQQALDAGSTNPAIYRELGRIETRAWFPQFDLYFRLPPDRADRLRDLLRKSIDYSPQQTEAYEMLAWVEAFAPTPNIRNVNLAQSQYEWLTNQDLTLLALAIVRHRVDDNPGALELLAVLEARSPTDQIRFGIESLRAKIENRPRNWAERSAPRKPTPQKIPRIKLPGKP